MSRTALHITLLTIRSSLQDFLHILLTLSSRLKVYRFFDKAVLSMLPLIDFKPDIIHCHDWQTGLLPYT